MRYLCSAATTLIALMILNPGSKMLGQTGTAGLAVDSNYTFVSQQRYSRTLWYMTYRAELANSGAALPGVTATVSSLVPTVTVVPGQQTIHFAPVPANGAVTSTDTFTILVDRSATFSFSALQWSFDSPVANAGLLQTVPVGSTVLLNGSGSTNPVGGGALTYSWAFTSRPNNSNAVLTNPNSVEPSFVADVAGQYVVTLTVSNGTSSDSASVTVSTASSAPVANAGPNQTVRTESTVNLDGSQSYDVNGQPLTYFWSLVSVPTGSQANLGSSYTSVSPTFTADQPGTYIAELTVSTATQTSAISTVTISTVSTAPVANAGLDQVVSPGSLVHLNGSASTDLSGNKLTYRWSLLSKPGGSTATLSDAAAVEPVFTADLAGTYVAQLIVNDGTVDSVPSTVTISTNAVLPPSANAGPDQVVNLNAVATLSGSGADPQNLPLTYSWALIERPLGSVAVLSNSQAASPTFTVDAPGEYVAQLITNNGYINSLPSTVVVTTGNVPPVANPGANQNVPAGTLVTLEGGASYDPNHNPLSYFWSLLYTPSGSSAILNGDNTVSTQFEADVAGTYVAQLIVNDGVLSSAPATTTITASVMRMTLTPNPLTLLLNAPGTLTLTLTQPAGPNGLVVNLSGYDPSVISIPATVTVPANGTTASITVTPLAAGSTNILATATGFVGASTAVTIGTPSLSITLPLGVGVAHTATGTVTLSAPAPTTGTVVNLASTFPNTATVAPPSLTITSGNASATFTVTGVSPGTTAITATASHYSSASSNILVAQLGAIGLAANVTVAPGQSAALNVTLSAPAPAGGETVTLTSSDTTKVTVTSSVFIAQGAVVPATQPQVTGVALGSANITASAPGYTGASQLVQVASVLSFAPSSVSIGAGGSTTVNLNLPSASPTAVLVNLASSNTSLATVPATVTIPANSTTVPVLVSAKNASGSVTITASTSTPNIGSGTLSVIVANYGGITVPPSVTVGLGQSAAFTVALTSPAPQGGVTIALSSSDSTKVSVSPATVLIPAGQTVPATQPQLTGVGPGSASITASASGFGSSTSAVQTTASLTLGPQNVSITGTASQTLTLTLSGPAPTGGLVVNLSANPAGVITIPSNVTILSGAKSATFAATGVSAGSSVITASAAASGVTSATDTITVQSAAAIILPSNVSVAPGQTVTFAVTLPSAAPQNGVTVTLASSDVTKLTISPLTVSIAAGQTQPATQPQITGVNFGSATITASASGYTTGSQPVSVAGTLTLSPSPLTITGPGTQNLTAQLSVGAPSALTLTLSASPSGVVSIPASVTLVKGATSVLIPVTSVGVGTATITANAGTPGVSTPTANVTVQTGGALTLPSGVSLALGKSASFAVTLPSPAPSGGVVVTLSSSDSTKVTVSPATVTIPAGATQASVAPVITGTGPGSASVTASAPLYTSATQSVQVTATIALTPQNATVGISQVQNLVLTLSGPAPAGGLAFSVSSGTPSVATVSASSYTIPANSTTVSIPVTGVSIGSSVISASAANVATATDTVTVNQAPGIVVPASILIGPGVSVSFPVSLASAPATSVTVNLAVANSSLATLSFYSVSFNAGQTQPTRSPTLNGVAAGTTTITASATGYANAVSQITVGNSATLTPSPLTIYGTTGTGTLTLTLSAPVQTATTFTLTSSNTAVATVLGQLHFPAGTATEQFSVSALSLGSTTISASSSGFSTVSANVNVQAQPSLTLSAANTSVQLGQSTTLTVGIPAAAGIGGLTVNLSSSNGDITISPTSVFISQGSTTGTAQATGANLGSSVVSASLTGYIAPPPVTLQVGATVSWKTPAVTIAGNGHQGTLTLILAGAVPSGSNGVTVNLSSSNTAVATVPATVTFPAGSPAQSTVQVPVTSVATGSATIHASGLNIPDVDATVTVTPPLAISTTSLPSGSAGTAYSATVQTTGGTQPVTFAASGLPANLTINASSGLISGTPQSSFNGPVTITASDSSSPTPQTATATLTLVIAKAPPAAIVATSGTPQSVTIGTAFQTLVATVTDASSKPVSGVTVTFTAPASGAGGAFAGGVNTATTNASGVATSAIFTANTIAGSYNVTATVSGVSAGATFALTNLAGPAASITATSGTPQTTVDGTAFALPLVATVVDASGNPVSNVKVTFTAPNSGPGGSFAGGVTSLSTTTNAAGQATSGTFTANTTTGTYGVAAAAAGVSTNAAFSLTNAVGTAKSIVVSAGSNQTAPVKTAFTTALAAVVKDANGNPVSGLTVTFTAPGSGASGTFTNGSATTTATTNASGIATSSTFTANSTTGSYSVNASVAGVSSPASFALTNSLGAPASVTVTSGSPQTAEPNAAFAAPLVVTVKDAGGNLLSGVSVVFTAPASGASGAFAGGVNTATTNASGVATSATFTANSSLGSYSVTAAVAGVSTPATFSLTNAVGAPASITATSGATQSAQVNAAFAIPLSATVKDSGGNPVSGVTVTFTAPSSSPTGHFANGTATTTAPTNSSGVATSTIFTANGVAGGPYSVTASVTGVSTPATFNLTNTAGTPGSITATSGTPQSAKIDTAFGAPLVATVKDSGGNAVSGVAVTFTAPGSGASIVFSGGGNTAVVNTNGSGIATSPAFTANGTAGSYNVSASAAGVSTPATFALTNQTGPIASLSVVSGSGQSAAINSAFSSPLKVIAKDAGGNPVSGVTVTFTPPGSGASGAFAGGLNTATTDSTGTATSAVFTANSTLGGPYTVAASASGFTANFSLTNLHGPAASIAVAGGNNQSTLINTAFGTGLSVVVKDSAGNPVSGAIITFTTPNSGASAAFPGSAITVNATTDSTGTATSPALTANATAGTFTVTAVTGSLSTSFSLTNTPGPPASITVTNGSGGQSASIDTAFTTPLTVLVADAGGNPISGVSVTFTAPTSGASGTFAGGSNTVTGKTTSAGTIAEPFTANGTQGTYSVTAAVNASITTSFSLTNRPGNPYLITIVSGSGQSTGINTAFSSPLQARVSDIGGNALRGITVLFTAPASGPGATFAGSANTASVVTDANGLATSPAVSANGTVGGPYNVTATTPAYSTVAAANFSLTNAPCTTCGGGTISVTSATIGQNLEAPIVITLNPPAPSTGVAVTIASSDSTRALVGNEKASFTDTIAGGTSTFSTTVEALVGSGTATISISAPGYATATSNITFGPSGFVIAGTNGVGGSMTVFQGTSTALTVYSGLLDNTGVISADQSVRGGLTVTVPVASSNTGAATVSSSTVVFNGGAGSETVNLNANASGTGSTNVALTTPGGFASPSTGASLTATVQQVGINAFTATVGQFLETTQNISLSGPAGSQIVLTLTSNNPSALLFSTSATTAGSASITLPIDPGHSISPPFYVQALANSGSPTYSISAPGYTTVNGAVTLAKSGLAIQSPGGFGATSFSAATNVGPVTLAVYTGYMDNSGNFLGAESVAGGQTVTVGVLSSNTSVGTVSPASFTIAAGSSSNSTTLTPLATGSTYVTASASSAFAPATVEATFTTPDANLLVSGDATIGYGLESPYVVTLPSQAGSNGQAVTIQSNSSSILLSPDGIAAGTSSLSFTVASGTRGPVSFYVQAFGPTGGTGTITISSSGYNTFNQTITFAETGVVIESYGGGSVGGSNLMALFPEYLDSTGTPVSSDEVIANPNGVVVGLTSSDPSVASVPATATIANLTSEYDATVTFNASGTAIISISQQPAGFTAPPSKDTSASVTVK